MVCSALWSSDPGLVCSVPWSSDSGLGGGERFEKQTSVNGFYLNKNQAGHY